MSYTAPLSLLCYYVLVFIIVSLLNDDSDGRYSEERKAIKAMDEIEDLYKYLVQQEYMTTNEGKDATASINSFLQNFRNLIYESTSKKDKCPEVYSGRASDVRRHHGNCQFTLRQKKKPLSTLVTICILAFEMTEKDLLTTIENMGNKYKDISIIIAIGTNQGKEIKKRYRDITYVEFLENRYPLWIWNNLIKSVATPYIFLGRGFSELGHYTNLTRAVHVLSEIPNVGVVSFGNLKKDQIWNIDCFQVTLKNYELRIFKGYQRSFNECTVCGYANGPFMMKSSTLKKYELDVNLIEENLGFLDLFLRLKKEGRLVVSCPDMMTLVSRSNYVLHLTKKSWLPFVQKWEVNQVTEPNGTSLHFSCAESSLSCNLFSYSKNGLKAPLCCLRATSKLLKDFINFCEKYNLHFEIDTGAALAAVKMNHAMPWDLDLDGCFHKDNISTFLKHKSELHQMGYSTKDENNFYYLQVRYSKKEIDGIYLEIWTYRPYMSVGNMYTGSFKPTKMIFDGFVVNVPYNPGLFARNRYGKEIYRHSPSWISFHREHSYANYSGGETVPCRKPEHHACMRHDDTDGNLELIEERD